MGLLYLAATALTLGNLALTTPVPQGGAGTAAKYCDAATTICYSEWLSPEKIAYRIAIPDTATAGNFDVLLQISAPKTVGWAGLAWGGVMVNNPLTVAWANGDTAVVSSRSARLVMRCPCPQADNSRKYLCFEFVAHSAPPCTAPAHTLLPLPALPTQFSPVRRPTARTGRSACLPRASVLGAALSSTRPAV